MGEILQSWIQARLGIMLDLAPKVFGYYTKDGRLLAQILLSYDIINRDQLDTIIDTQDPALCRLNLKHLGVWLRFLGVDCTDESIEEISCGKGTTSLRLFYKVYLSLETKDRLHFITLQKEREKFVPCSKKFDVITVCEEPPPYQPPDHPLSRKLCEGKDTVDWHLSKFPTLLRKLKQEREKLEDWKPFGVLEHVDDCGVDEKPIPVDATKCQESEELDRFARKHRVHPKCLKECEECQEFDEEQTLEIKSSKIVEDPEMAKAYVTWLKSRSKRTNTLNVLKSKMQKALLSQLWEKIEEKQERAFDEAIASRVLEQSNYEKQIVTKLCEVRDQKNIMAENQKILEDMTLEANEVEHRASVEREKDMDCTMERDIELECRRMCELMQRLHERKIQKLRAKHQRICREVAEDLVSLALKIVAYRRANDGHVPTGILREWQTLFLRCQPIFDDEIACEIEGHVGEEDKEEVLAEVTRIKLEQVEALQEALFEDYHEGNSPWKEFLPLLAEDAKETFELGRVVVGYVVHRLLNYFRSDPADRVRASLPKFANSAIILGITDPTVHETIRELLEKNNIRLVRMEDAINYCLEQYKNEMADVEYIDLNVVAATQKIVQQLQTGTHRISCLKSRWSSERSRVDEVGSRPSKSSTSTKGRGEKRKEKKKSAELEKKPEEQLTALEKQTQTPRNIPFDDLDPLLTDTAYIGKWTYEFLALGEPISNDLATKVLLEYLKSFTNAVGWALVEYPNTYEQLFLLEAALTGFNIPPDPDCVEFEDIPIEDVVSVTPRIVYEEVVDPSTLYRQSRLLPNPTKRPEDNPGATFATLFVRVAQKPKNLEIEERSYEPLKPDMPSIDKFYASQMIAYLFYYYNLDLTTLKKLARLVVGNPSQRMPSTELFGDVLTSYEREKGRSVVSKPPVVRRLLAEPVDEDLLEDDLAEREEEADFMDYDFQAVELELIAPKPGEHGWEWVDLPIPPVFVEYLAHLADGVETTYIEGMKELLFLKSMHSSGIIPYKEFVTKAAAEFVNRPHNQQDLVHNFHTAFNAIDDDARIDVDVKCELHRRVADLQAQLWQVCDERRHESEEERKRLINDQWTAYEARVLFNVYIGITQVEIDRCSDMMHLLHDYYLAMLKKPLQEPRFTKLVLNRMEVDGIESFAEPIQEVPDRKETKEGSRGKSGSSKTVLAAFPTPPAAADFVVLHKEIGHLLTDRNKAFLDPDEISMFRTIVENVRYGRSIVDGLHTIANDAIKREEVAVSKRKALPVESSDPEAVKVASRGQDLVLEWRYAVAYEIERIRLRLEAITAAARSDVGFLLETMRKTYHGIHDSILDRYWREMKSVNDMVNVFCFAIEEARPLEREMLLDDDRFVVRSNVYLMAVESDVPTVTREALSASRFRIAQLSQLMEMLKRVAPHGSMAELALVYILQDLVSHGMGEGEPLALPCCWYQLRSREIASLVGQLFKSADYVDWREFIFYALELPMPSPQEILIARDRFRIQDPGLTEVVSCAQFHRTSLWFLDATGPIIDVYQLLRDDFQRNIEELYEEELYHLSCNGNSKEEGSTIFQMQAIWENPEETLRMILAKELLCRMYTTGRNAVNYTAILLAFCKNENPRDGFAKALALALGNRVCSDLIEGERYVEELYQQRRLAREMRLSSRDKRHENLEVSMSIMRYLMTKVDRAIQRTMYPEELDETAGMNAFETRSSNSEEMEYEGVSLSSSLLELDRVYKDRSEDQELVIYWLPLEACLTVLAASLPWHTLKSDLFGPWGNLRDALAAVYEELRVNHFIKEDNVVLAHRLLNHDFITKLLSSVGKFTSKSMGGMVRDILRAREETKPNERPAFINGKTASTEI